MEPKKEKDVIKIHPSELARWLYCKKRWLFEYFERRKKLPPPPYEQNKTVRSDK